MSDYSKVVNTRWFIGAFIVSCLPALYAYNPFPLYFLNDDFIHVPLSQEAVWGQRNSIRPFNDLTLYLDSLFWKTNAVGYHLTNLVIHCINTFLIYFLALLILPFLKVETNQKFWSAGAALLFWGYAFHSESVFWVIGRTGCLSTLFFLVCFIIFLSGARKWYHYLISFFLFFCSLLTYESVWILPPVMVLFSLCFKRFRGVKNHTLIIGYWLIFTYYFYLRIQLTGEVAGNYEGENFKAFNIVSLASNYLKLIARSFVGPQLKSAIFLSTAVAFCGLLILVVAQQVKKHSFCFTWVVYTGVMLFSFTPYISLGIDTHGVEAERYLYLPSVFVCVLLVALLAHFKNRKIAISAYFIYFLYNQFYLLKEADAFKVASFLSRSTIEQVVLNKHKQHFYFKNLPKENYGVPIFRLGLEEGVNWLSGETSAARKIRVLSFIKDENYRFSQTPKLVKNRLIGPLNVYNYSTRFLTKGGDYSTSANEALIEPNQDLLIEYSDSAIIIHK